MAIVVQVTAASVMTALACLTISELRSYDFTERRVDFGYGATVQRPVIPISIHDVGSVVSSLTAAAALWMCVPTCLFALRLHGRTSLRPAIIATVVGVTGCLCFGYFIVNQPVRGGSEFRGMAMVAQAVSAFFAWGSSLLIGVLNAAFLWNFRSRKPATPLPVHIP